VERLTHFSTKVVVALVLVVTERMLHFRPLRHLPLQLVLVVVRTLMEMIRFCQQLHLWVAV
jgi:hypothetical protein